MVAQSAGSVEYTDCTSAKGLRPQNEYPRFDTKLSDDEAAVILELWKVQCTPS